MSLTIKICGLRETKALEASIEAGADMVGFVFFEPSPRHVTLTHARALGPQVRGRALKVALTVDANDATLAAIIEALQPDLLQLHGDETPARVAGVRAKFGRPVIKALALSERGDLARIAAYDRVADHLLFDARAPDGASRPGGNGNAFDWSILREIGLRQPWLLAGGLHDDNVAAALRATGAPGLDVSSGVESMPGHKDLDRIATFVAVARASIPSATD